VIARLEESGLVVRAADPADRRSSLVSLSPAGAALLDEVRTRKDAFLSQRLEALGREDRATLERAAELLEDLLA
jgi:DNA-binding MarR family transcriptional regulator